MTQYVFPNEQNETEIFRNLSRNNDTHRLSNETSYTEFSNFQLNFSSLVVDLQRVNSMKNQNKKVAIIHYGILRANKSDEVHASYEKFVFKPLRDNGYEIYRFLHTWRQDEDSYVWDKKIKKANITHELSLFHPPLAAYSVSDSQEEFMKNVNFSHYFNQTLFNLIGDNGRGEWFPFLVRNLLWGLQSLKRAAHLAALFEKLSSQTFDIVFCMRPDTIIENLNLIEFLKTIHLKPKIRVYIPNYMKGNGANDQFAIVLGNMTYALPLFERYDSLREYRKTRGRIVSEEVMRYQLKKFYANQTGELPYRHKLVGRTGRRSILDAFYL